MMKNILTFVVTGTLILLTACSGETKQNARQIDDQVEATVESAKKDAIQNKEAFIAETEKQIQKLNRNIEEAEQKLKKHSNEVKEGTKQKLEELKKQRDNIQDELAELKDAGQQNWQEMKASVQEDLNSFKESYNQFIENLQIG
jgi:TolA-binding protein